MRIDRRRPRGGRSLLFLSLLLLLPVAADGQDSVVDFRWADRPDFDAVAATQTRLKLDVTFTTLVGEGPDGPSLVVAHDEFSGAMLWQRRFPERITGLATTDAAPFMTGVLERPGRPARLVTRLLNGRTGAEAWRRFDSLGGDDAAPPVLVRDRGKLFVVGGSADRFQVISLDLAGRLRWRDAGVPDAGVLAENWRVAAIPRGTEELYVGGTRHRAPGQPSPMVVRRYDADTGEVLWEAELGTGVGIPRDLVFDLREDIVVVVGETLRPENGLPRWTVHALDRESGSHLWTDQPFPARRASSTAAALAVGRAGSEGPVRIFVVGHVSRARRRPVIRAYETDGDLAWQRRGTTGRQGDFADVMFHHRLGPLAVGAGRQPGDRVDRVVAVAFDPVDGTRVWRRFGPAGVGGGRLDVVFGGPTPSVIAAGVVRGAGGTAEPLIHAYRIQ